MIKDSAFLRKASTILRLHRKLEGLRLEGGISGQSYGERRARLDGKVLSLKGEHERLLEVEGASIDEGILRLEELSTGGLLSSEKYNSLVVERSREKSRLESERDLVQGFGVVEYLDYLRKQFESAGSELPKKVEVKPSEKASHYAAPMDISFMIISVVGFFILLGVAAFISGNLISFFSIPGHADSSSSTSTVAVERPLTKASTTTAGGVVETSTIFSSSTTTKVAGTTTFGRPVDFTEFLEYDQVCCITEVGGKLAFIAWGDGKSFVVYDEREMRGTYDGVDSVKAVSSSLVYLARKLGKSFVVFGESELEFEYDSVLDFAPFGDSLAFVVEDGGEEFVVFEGREFGKRSGYSGVANLTLVGGKLAFIALKDGRSLAVYDGREVASVSGDVVYGSLTDVDGKLAFEVKADGNSSVFYDKTYVGQEYHSASSPTEVNGKLAFIASSGGKDFVVYDGKPRSEKYDQIIPGSLRDIGGNMAFIAVKYYLPKGKEFLVYSDKKFSGEYDSIPPESLSEVNGKPVFLAVSDGRKILVQDGTEVRTSYDSIESFGSIGGSLAFSAKKGSEGVVFYRGSEVGVGRGYDRIYGLTELGGKLAFIAEIDGKSFVVLEK